MTNWVFLAAWQMPAMSNERNSKKNENPRDPNSREYSIECPNMIVKYDRKFISFSISSPSCETTNANFVWKTKNTYSSINTFSYMYGICSTCYVYRISSSTLKFRLVSQSIFLEYYDIWLVLMFTQFIGICHGVLDLSLRLRRIQ